MKKIIFLILVVLYGIIAEAQSVRLTISDTNTYDMSGVTRKGSPGLYKYFEPTDDIDARITREVADFNRDSLAGTRNGLGWRGIIVFPKRYILDSIKFHDASGSIDTALIWTLKDMVKPDTLSWPINYTPDYQIISCGTCNAWEGAHANTKINANANDTLQYLFVVFRRTTYSAFGNTFTAWPNISNVGFWAHEIAGADTIYNKAFWADDTWTAKPIDSIVGNFNIPNQQDTLWHDTATASGNYGYFRSFDQSYYDDSASKHNYKFNLGGGGYTGYKYNAALARRGNYQFAVVFGNNDYFNFQLDSMHHSVNKGWSTNTVFDDPQKPESYSRKGQYMGFLAQHGGGNTTPRYYPTYNGTMEYGLGYLKGLGTTNEATLFAFANAWKTPWEVAAEAHGVYDSVKLGDPNMPVFVGAYEAYNYDDAKATILGLKIFARSRSIKTDGLAFHGIHTLKTDSFSVIPTTDQQIGNRGVSVGYWDDWRKNIQFVLGIRREAGNASLLVQIDEDGFQKGKYKRYPSDAGETFTVSQLGAPRFQLATGGVLGFDSSFAIAGLQTEMIATASPLYKHYWYQIVDDQLSSENPNYDGVDQSNGKFDRPVDFTDHPESWTIDYATVSFKKRIGRYYFIDSVTNTSRGIHVFKYRHVSNADSIMYVYAVLDSVGTATVHLTGLNNTSGKIIQPSFTSRTASESTGTITAGAIDLSADALPRAFIVYSPSASGNTVTKSPKYSNIIRVHSP